MTRAAPSSSGAALDRPLRVAAVDGYALEAARRPAGRPLDQAREQAGGPRAGRPLHRPHHARGRRHARQGARPLRPRRCAPTPTTRRCAPVAAVCVYGVAGGRGARRAGGHRPCTWRRWRGPSPPGRATCERAPGGDPPRGGRRRRRDRHRPQPRGAAGGAPGRGARRGGGLQGGLRRRPPEDDPGDRRARLVRDGPPGLDGRHGRRQRRHQDLHRQAARVAPPRAVALCMAEAIRDFADADRAARWA